MRSWAGQQRRLAWAVRALVVSRSKAVVQRIPLMCAPPCMSHKRAALSAELVEPHERLPACMRGQMPAHACAWTNVPACMRISTSLQMCTCLKAMRFEMPLSRNPSMMRCAVVAPSRSASAAPCKCHARNKSRRHVSMCDIQVDIHRAWQVDQDTHHARRRFGTNNTKKAKMRVPSPACTPSARSLSHL